MKKLLFFVTTLLVITSCASTKDGGLSRAELRNEKKLAKVEIVKKAVEARRYIIKLDKMHFASGGIIDLMPRANYIIIDGNKAVVRAAYMGRSYEFKPVAGINLVGKTANYQLTNHVSSGNFEIKMVVDNGTNSFDIYLSISKTGNCTASINTMRIDYTNYDGHLVPIKEKNSSPAKDQVVI
jgi:hypothetical protein